MNQVYDLFPIPFMRVPAALDADVVAELVQHFSSRTLLDNNSSSRLSHTRMLQPSEHPLFAVVANRVSDQLADFGSHLFAEKLGWSLKEMWVNVLESGGRQAMHNHANSFISGVIYLTRTHPESNTVFMKSPGGSDFMFRNDHQGIAPTQYSADKWVSPSPDPGDMVLFPSYLMHAVPPNQGERRVTLAFNAIPARLDSWGYTVRFSG